MSDACGSKIKDAGRLEWLVMPKSTGFHWDHADCKVWRINPQHGTSINAVLGMLYDFQIRLLGLANIVRTDVIGFGGRPDRVEVRSEFNPPVPKPKVTCHQRPARLVRIAGRSSRPKPNPS